MLSVLKESYQVSLWAVHHKGSLTRSWLLNVTQFYVLGATPPFQNSFLLALTHSNKCPKAAILTLFHSYLYLFFFLHSLLPEKLKARPELKLQRWPTMRSEVAVCYIHMPSHALRISQKQVQGVKLSHLRKWWEAHVHHLGTIITPRW